MKRRSLALLAIALSLFACRENVGGDLSADEDVLRIKAALEVTPNPVVSGRPFTLRGSGFQPNQAIRIAASEPTCCTSFEVMADAAGAFAVSREAGAPSTWGYEAYQQVNRRETLITSVSLVVTASCGDGACQSGETCSSCPGDCGSCSSPDAGTGDAGPADAGQQVFTSTFTCVEDTTTRESEPSANFGGAQALEADGSPMMRAYLKFTVANLTRRVASARLRLYVVNPSTSGTRVWSAATNWSEGTMTWATQATKSGAAPLSETGPVYLDTWVELDVTSQITGNGTFGFVLINSLQATDGSDFSSREGAFPPQLVIETSGEPVPSDGAAPTVSLTAPAAGATYSSAQTVSVVAAASDDVGVVRVEFFDNGRLMGHASSMPFEWPWSVAATANGEHVWTARAYDHAGKSTLSAGVTTTVAMASCGDARCDLGETCSDCPADCGDCISCGDSVCEGTESCSNCAVDCGACVNCGNGTCESSESCSSCPADCGKCVVCGDAICDATESCSSCAGDCGACPIACAPALRAPANLAQLFTPFPNLLFDRGSCAATDVAWYEVQISRNDAFDDLVEDDHSYIGRHVHAQELAPGAYFWRVRAVASDGRLSSWSPEYGFTVQPPSRTVTVPAGSTRAQIQAIFDSAKLQARTLVQFAAGATYTIDGCTAESHCFTLINAQSLTVDGNGAHFVVRTPDAGFLQLYNTRDVTVKNFDVDYDPLPFCELVIRSVSIATNTVEADVVAVPRMPQLDAAHMKYEPNANYRKWSKMIDPKAPGRISPHAQGMYNIPFDPNITNLGNGRFRILHAQIAREAQVGDILHKQARVNGATLFMAHKSDNVALHNLVSYASPGGLVNTSFARASVISNVQVRVKQGRYASNDADNIHARAMTLGPWVENSLFWGTMDDHVNLRPDFVNILSKSGNQITVSRAVAAGDRVGISDTTSGAAVLRTVVSASTDGTVLTLDGPPGVGNLLYPYAEAAPMTVIRNNSFLGGQRLGLLLRVKNAVVAGNVFDRTGSAAISLENHPWWNPPEGLSSEDVLIVNNEFRLIPSVHFGSLFAAIMKADSTLATGPRMLQRIRVLNNTFLDWNKHAIDFNHGLDVDIGCNRITADPATPVGTSASAINVNDSSTVRIFDNRIDDPRSGFTPVTVSTSCDNVTQSGNGPTGKTDTCRFVPGARGASSAPLWPPVASGQDLPPSVALTSPTTGSRFTAAGSVALRATASDDVGVAKVEFLKDGVVAGTDWSAPYEWSWAVSAGVNGTHSWTAKAWDTAGNVTVSAAVSLTVEISSGVSSKFTLVVLPDTQFMTQKWPSAFNTMTQWVADNAQTLSIPMVLQVGDVQADPSNLNYFANARTAMKLLDGKVPFSIALGNHDLDCITQPAPRDCSLRLATAFNQYFPLSEAKLMPTFGGSMPEGTNDNQYHFFRAGNVDWLLISLKHFVKPADRTWANQLIAAHPGRNVIINVHEYLDGAGNRTFAGETLWTEVVKKHKNVVFVFCGHLNTASRRVDLGEQGNKVYQMLSDYQDAATLNPNTYLRLLELDPTAGTVGVRTYSPVLNRYMTDTANEFSYSGVDMTQP